MLKINNKTLWVFAGLIQLLYFITALNLKGIYLVDSVDYLSQAQNLLNHGSLYAAPWNGPFRVDYFSFRPPTYSLLIIACKSIIDSDFSILFMQSILSILNLFMLWRLLLKFGVNHSKANLYIFLTCIFYPSQFIHCNFVMSDILFQTQLLLIFYSAIIFLESFKTKGAWLISVLLVIAMLTKPVAMLLGFTLFAYFLFKIYGKRPLKILLPFILLPLTYYANNKYNERITGYFHYSSVKPIFALKYMAKYTNAQVFGENYADSFQDVVMQKANNAVSYQQRVSIMETSATDVIKENWLIFALFNLKGFVAFWIDPGRFEWYHFLNIEEESFPGLYHLINTKGIDAIPEFYKTAPLGIVAVLLLSLIWNIAIFLLFLVFVFDKNQNKILKILAITFIGYIMISTGVLGLSRYRVAVAPEILLCAFLAIEHLLAKKFKIFLSDNLPNR